MDNKKTNNKKKKQRTLGAFGFTKSVSHQGEKVQIKLPDFSDAEAAKSTVRRNLRTTRVMPYI